MSNFNFGVESRLFQQIGPFLTRKELQITSRVNRNWHNLSLQLILRTKPALGDADDINTSANQQKQTNSDVSGSKIYALSPESFIHPSIVLKGTKPNQGLFVTSDIAMGEVLMYEKSLVCIATQKGVDVSETDVMPHMMEVRRKHPFFYDMLAASESALTPFFSKFLTNSDFFSQGLDYHGISGWNAKINHGFPATVGRSMLVRPPRASFLSLERYFVEIFSSTNLKAGTQLVLHYHPVIRASTSQLCQLRDYKQFLENCKIPSGISGNLPWHESSFYLSFQQRIQKYVKLRKETNGKKNKRSRTYKQKMEEIRGLQRFFQSNNSKLFKKRAFANGGIAKEMITFVSNYGHVVGNFSEFEKDIRLIFGCSHDALRITYQMIIGEQKFCSYCHKFGTRHCVPCSDCFFSFYCNNQCLEKGEKEHQPYCRHRKLQ